MTLHRVQVSDFRCLHSLNMALDSHYTLVSGPNASGKTSLLEAIYVLSRGRSFRTRRLDRLIRQDADRFIIFGEIDLPERRVALGLEGSKEGVRARMGGERVSSLAALAEMLPAQVIDPEVHRLIEDGPSQRRRFMDWGVFHVEHDFIGRWQQYQHVLKQRNAALRSRQSRAVISAWDPELIRLGEDLTQSRVRYVRALSGIAEDIALRLLGLELKLSFRWGWNQELTLAEALARSVASEGEMGSTQVGPQRAEIAISLDGLPVRDRISRGQQKLLASALLLAQLKLFPADSPIQPTLLLDDPAAELDSDRLAELIREVQVHGSQLVVTTLGGQLPAFGSPGRHYAIANGQLLPIG